MRTVRTVGEAGLAADLWQMSRESGVRLRIEAARVPMAAVVRRCRRRRCGCRVERHLGPVYHALMDGEDFELLFAVSPAEARRVPRRLGRCPVTPLSPAGFKHF